MCRLEMIYSAFVLIMFQVNILTCEVAARRMLTNLLLKSGERGMQLLVSGNASRSVFVLLEGHSRNCSLGNSSGLIYLSIPTLLRDDYRGKICKQLGNGSARRHVSYLEKLSRILFPI